MFLVLVCSNEFLLKRERSYIDEVPCYYFNSFLNETQQETDIFNHCLLIKTSSQSTNIFSLSWSCLRCSACRTVFIPTLKACNMQFDQGEDASKIRHSVSMSYFSAGSRAATGLFLGQSLAQCPSSPHLKHAVVVELLTRLLPPLSPLLFFFQKAFLPSAFSFACCFCFHILRL